MKAETLEMSVSKIQYLLRGTLRVLLIISIAQRSDDLVTELDHFHKNVSKAE